MVSSWVIAPLPSQELVIFDQIDGMLRQARGERELRLHLLGHSLIIPGVVGAQAYLQCGGDIALHASSGQFQDA
jgi:hypothetical protein